jgi:hypothetical protein
MFHRLRLTRRYRSFAFLAAAIVLFLSGCGAAAEGAVLQQKGAAAGPTSGVALLAPQPSGTAELTWDPATDNTLTVAVNVLGLVPANEGGMKVAAYPASLNMGSCTQRGNVVQQLPALMPDKNGTAKANATMKGVTGGIPANGWILVVESPAMNNTPGTALACGEVVNPQAPGTMKQSTKVLIHGLTALNGGQSGTGAAQLSLSGTTLTVTIDLAGLPAGSKHEAHIHSGSCGAQGAVVHPLNPMTANSSGVVHEVTIIQNVTSLPNNWFINVHNSTDLTTQAGYQPVACGDVYTR